MPAVISKYAAKYNIQKEYVTRGVVGFAVVLYGLKLGYPYLQSLCKHPSTVVVTHENGTIIDNNNRETKENALQKKTRKKPDGSNLQSTTASVAQRIGVNVKFLIQLRKLVRLMVPGFWTPECGVLILHTIALFTRTFLSIYVASMEGHIVKHIVRKDVYNFSIMLLKWLGVAIPATFINSMIRYLEQKLALAFR